MTPTKRRQMDIIAASIKECRDCPGMNEPKVSESAPGFGSVDSPVVIVGQSLCRQCMAVREPFNGVPFTGGSGRYIDEALEQAGRRKDEIFITNVVHCHPPGNRKSKTHEKDSCRHFLHEELDVVQPVLAVGLGEDARTELRTCYADGHELPWPFVKPSRVDSDTTYLLFPEHPGSLRFKKTPEREYYSPSLADAIGWSFDVRRATPS